MLQNVVDLIGNTPVLPLRRLTSPDHARVVVKLEAHNPTGSMKDRAALAIVQRAAESGRLRLGDTIVECTGGSTGTFLASMALALGYRCLLVTSDAFNEEKPSHMRWLGAELEIFPSDKKRITAELVKGMIERSRELSLQPRHFWADQFSNTDVLTGYLSLADELWEQTQGAIDAIVQAVGTGGSLRGTSEHLRNHRRDIRLAAVEPAESPVLSGEAPGANRPQGIGMDYRDPALAGGPCGRDHHRLCRRGHSHVTPAGWQRGPVRRSLDRS
jgi:cysteine synthase